MARLYALGLRSTIRDNAAAWGYSVTITATFAVVDRLNPRPTVGDIFLFVAGAGSAFALIEGIASRGFREKFDERLERALLLGSAFKGFSASGAVGLAALVAWLLDGWSAWLLASLVASGSFLLASGLEMAIAAALEHEDRY